jgi:hypothetical protein
LAKRWRAICGECLRAVHRGRIVLSIRERVATILPEPFTTAPMRALPFLLLFGAMFYRLWKVRGRRALPVLVRHDSVPLATRAK